MDDIKKPSRRRYTTRRTQRDFLKLAIVKTKTQTEAQTKAQTQTKNHTKPLVRQRALLVSPMATVIKVHLKIRKPSFSWITPLKSMRIRVGMASLAVLLLAFEAITVLQPLLTQQTYALGRAGALLPEISQPMADKLKLSQKDQAFQFNAGGGQSNPSNPKTASIINGPDDKTSQATAQQVSITAHQDAAKGVTVTDPANKVDMTMKPDFKLLPGKQDGDRIIYPLADGNGWVVYAMHGTGIKEDIILKQATSDRLSFSFKLGLDDSKEARLERDGSIGVYGNSLFGGNISTGTEADAALLQKARQKATKDTLLFKIPKPVVIEADKKNSAVRSAYSLTGKTLTVTASGLLAASYPLSIDPSIYVATAQQFMQGNNETNIDFNVTDSLIQKGKTTGARFDSWNETSNLPAPTWGGGTAATGGYVYSVGGVAQAGQKYTTQGLDIFVVPPSVTSLVIKSWGGGGGGGGGGATAIGGAGGGGGYVTATVSVTPGETLNVYVGGRGEAGQRNTTGGGGGGGGFSSLYRGSTQLALAAGGAGGGGGRAGSAGAAGGAAGGAIGVAGTAAGVALGGAAGTASAGGAAGGGGNNPGSAGTSLAGGAGGDGRTSAGADGSGAVGGLASGGGGGLAFVNTRSGGGGGGGGFFGGGGGSGSSGATGAGGGGGGSSFTVVGATSVTNTAGAGTTPGNSGDTGRNGAGNGGLGGLAASNGTVGSNGTVAITYGGGGTAPTQSVAWAQFNTGTGTVDDANPGSGNCSGWCTTAAYNLPSARANFSLVAYSGFLYAIGGTDSAGTRTNTVYIAKLGANGEPRLWHPTDPNQSNWVYWHTDASMNLSSIRAYSGAVAYNNRLYLLGGMADTTPVATVEYANIDPTGTLGPWTGSTALPSARYGHSVQVYNDRLYLLGGSTTQTGVPLNTAHYIKVNTDGTLSGNWIQTTSFTTGRLASGGSIATVWGAYIYISGGCSAINSPNGYCTSVTSDTQLASINADGSLDVWNNVGGVSSQRTGHNLLAWRGYIYQLGGCSAQNATTGDCNTGIISSIAYGAINQDGDASTVGQSVANGSGSCVTPTFAGCNLPGTTNVGNMLSAVVITNGYLYVIGGCTDNPCSATNGNVAYVSISSSGTMTRPATCPVGTYQGGAWCVNTTNVITGGVAATSPVVFNGRIYLIGGLNGTANVDALSYTSVNNDGSIGAWTTQTMSGAGAASVSYLYAYSRANPLAAATIPGNLYIFGGCLSSSAAGCTTYSDEVRKCNIATNGAVSSCTRTGQMQIGTLPGANGTGLGVMSGTVYANYIYLIGGVAPNLVDLDTVRYAKFDNNNNVVAVSGTTWIQATNTMLNGRRRAAAFGYNGYLYVVGGFEAGGGGVLADIEFVKINVSNGSLGSATDGFKESAVTINQRWGLSVSVSNSFAYVIGGCTSGDSPNGCATRTDVIQTFQVYNNDSGAPNSFTTSANTYGTSPSRIGASSTILNGYIYTAGGCTSPTDCTTAIDTVSYAPLDVNGTVGAWTNTAAALPAVRTWGKLQAAGGTLYYIGGQSSTATDERPEVYYGTPTAGNVTAWATASNGLPAARTTFGAAVWNNRLYVVGGLDVNAANTSTIYVSPQLNTGGNITSAWSAGSTPFNVPRSGAAVTAYANNLYLLGGNANTIYLSDTQYSQIDATTGLVAGWTYSTSLPGSVSQAESFAANGYIYLIGGRSTDTVCDPIALAAPISANTTIVTGNNPTGVGEWYETNQRYVGARYGASAAYYEGKAYVLGGGCGSTLTYASPVIQQTTLLSQPQVAKYSIAMDTDSEVFPSKWLLNGVDNAVGARWQLKYRSMTGFGSTQCTSPSMTTWGQETIFGDVTLALPGNYIPKNAAGANTGCARHYYFNVTVDSSQAFGYPDDVSRGPTITDLTLQFTADPSKRLMHGRTFTGGLQQPDDTPYYAN